ncbi:MAG: hypothetical protein IKE55_11845 [Kiritimatiellae bacterium]|nr:hypothetical protein [Kiritimatiellia bacterium]
MNAAEIERLKELLPTSLGSAEETFAKLAAGAIGVEPYAEEGEEDDTAQDVAGSPAFGEAHPTRLLD